MIRQLQVKGRAQQLKEITDLVQEIVKESRVEEGLCTVFIQHTSASLTIQENADPSAKTDLEEWLKRLVPEGDPHFTHTLEGPDDMPSHIKSVLTSTSISVPIMGNELALGTWQGIYLWEHRRRPTPRSILVHIGGD